MIPKFRAFHKKEKKMYRVWQITDNGTFVKIKGIIDKWIKRKDGVHRKPECDAFVKNNLLKIKEVITLLQSTGLFDNTKWEDLSKDEQQDFMIENKFLDEITAKEAWKGKEIFEGDILEHTLTHKKGHEYRDGEVLKKDETWKCKILVNDILPFGSHKAPSTYLQNDTVGIKIIGNKFENPELLKENRND